MKTSFYTESILYWLARSVSALAQRLPAQVNAAIGRGLGGAAYGLFASRRGDALGNLRAAFGERYTPEEYQQILKRLFQNLGMTLMEVAHIPAFDKLHQERWIEIAPGCRERLEKALKLGKGVILVAGHFGNWEYIPLTGATLGFPTTLLARQQGWPRLNQLLTQYRESKGCKIVTKGFPIRDLIDDLKQGRVIGILADQDGGSRGILAPFFGRLASTAPGIAALSYGTGAPILPIFMVRVKGPKQCLIIEEPLSIPSQASTEEQMKIGIASYLRVLEKYVRQHPDHWLWLHRRWKTTPELRIMIFSDGKAGHLNQSKALAQRIAQAWNENKSKDSRLEGRTQPLTQTQTVEIKYRSGLRRLVLGGVSCFAHKRYAGGDKWLRWGLAPESYRAIRCGFANIAISCGASMAPVNLLWSRAIRCRPIHVTKSQFPSWKRFDLSVIPRHDEPPVPMQAIKRRKVLLVDGALVPQHLTNGQEPRQDWRKKIQLSKPRRIGVLVGGPTRGIALGQSELEPILKSILSAAETLDAELLVTSSRRTPLEVEQWLENEFGKNPRCRLLTLVNRSQTGGLADTAQAVPCIFDLSDSLVVSGDSISMISEAVATGKPVVSFLSGSGTKYHRFLNQMNAQGKLTFVGPNQIDTALTRPIQADPNRQPKPDEIVEFFKGWL